MTTTSPRCSHRRRPSTSSESACTLEAAERAIGGRLARGGSRMRAEGVLLPRLALQRARLAPREQNAAKGVASSSSIDATTMRNISRWSITFLAKGTQAFSTCFSKVGVSSTCDCFLEGGTGREFHLLTSPRDTGVKHSSLYVLNAVWCSAAVYAVCRCRAGAGWDHECAAVYELCRVTWVTRIQYQGPRSFGRCHFYVVSESSLFGHRMLV